MGVLGALIEFVPISCTVLLECDLESLEILVVSFSERQVVACESHLSVVFGEPESQISEGLGGLEIS